jgi:hypothetical protein
MSALKVGTRLSLRICNYELISQRVQILQRGSQATGDIFLLAFEASN